MERQRVTSFITGKTHRCSSLISKQALHMMNSTRQSTRLSKIRQPKIVSRHKGTLSSSIAIKAEGIPRTIKLSKNSFEKSYPQQIQSKLLYKPKSMLTECPQREEKENQCPSSISLKDERSDTPLREASEQLRNYCNNRFYDRIAKMDDQLSKFYDKYFKQ